MTEELDRPAPDDDWWRTAHIYKDGQGRVWVWLPELPIPGAAPGRWQHAPCLDWPQKGTGDT